MYCPHCGKPMNETLNFCPECGSDNRSDEPQKKYASNHSPAGPVKEQQPQQQYIQSYTPTMCGLAITGFIFAFVFNIAGLIISIVALNKINSSNGRLVGHGLAVAGIWLSSIFFTISVFFWIGIAVQASQGQ